MLRRIWQSLAILVWQYSFCLPMLTLSLATSLWFSSSASAQELTLGSEPTVTNSHLIQAKIRPRYRGDDQSTSEGEATLEALKHQIEKNCPLCKFEEDHTYWGLRAIKVKTSTEFSFLITQDIKVIELILSPLTSHFFDEQENIVLVQRLIYDSAHQIGLYPHVEYGGAHIHLGRSSFGGNPLFFRNFVVDWLVHNSDIMQAFGSGPYNSPILFDLSRRQQRAFFRIVKDFDERIRTEWLQKNATADQGEQMIDDFVHSLQNEVFDENPKGIDPAERYQGMNFTRMISEEIAKHARTVELRFFRAFRSAFELATAYRLVTGHWKSIRELSVGEKASFVPLDFTPPALFDVHDRVARILAFFKRTGVALRDGYPLLYQDDVKREIFLKHLQKPFDEANTNPALYARAEEIRSGIDFNSISNFDDSAFEASKKQRRLVPFAKFISDDEAIMIEKATAQRANAYAAFLDDLASGKQGIVKAGVLPAALLHSLFEKFNLPPDHFKQFAHQNAGFFYAPDLLRGPDGKLMIIEDNVGYTGGMADALEARRDMATLMPGYSGFQADNGRSVVQNIAALAQLLTPPGGADYVNVSISHTKQNKSLTFWKASLAKEGFYLLDESAEGKNMWVDQKRQELVLPDGSRKKIKNIVVRNIEDFPREFPQLWKSFLRGEINVIGGLDLLMFADKELSIYVEEMIRYYLHEEPILKYAPTMSFRRFNAKGKPVLDQSLVHRVFSDLHEWVVKPTGGCQGAGVCIGYKETDPESVQSEVLNAPEEFVAQRFFPPSELRGYISDVRSFAVVVGKQIRVSNYFWSRVLSAKGNGLLNLHQEAMVVPVFRASEADHHFINNSCRDIFHKAQ